MTATATIIVVLVLLLLFDWVYFDLICPAVQQSLKYDLFAVRDRLRYLKIEDQNLDLETYRVMETRINGCIRLVSSWSVRRWLIDRLRGCDDRDKKLIKKMQQIVRKILQKKNTNNTYHCLFEIETDTMRYFRRAILLNSLLPGWALSRWVLPCENKTKLVENIENEIITKMIIHTALSV
ncbi:MAG: hypothetical protein LBF88_11105 [Planctomycetaceae bacterium]|jgi:hypothetical protein|nr:hypothetical protein [Planctomycetaceae bacterium]